MTERTLLSQIPEISNLVENNESLSEVMVNPDGKIWTEVSGALIDTGIKLESSRVFSVIRLLAGFHGFVVDEKTPELSAKLPVFHGGRFHALIPPVVSKPMFSIRFPPRKTFSLDDLLESKTITPEIYKRIEEAVEKKENMLIAGATGSGKTTIANAIMKEITEDRLIVIEDNPEIISNSSNAVHILTNPDFSLRDAVRASLRLRPDRIIIGEIRDGGTALDLCKAWLTGHPGGVGTIHASSAKEVPQRLFNLMQEVVQTPDKTLIDKAIDLIFFVKKIPLEGGKFARRVTEMQ